MHLMVETKSNIMGSVGGYFDGSGVHWMLSDAIGSVELVIDGKGRAAHGLLSLRGAVARTCRAALSVRWQGAETVRVARRQRLPRPLPHHRSLADIHEICL